jgi:hypothetical protein
MRNCSASGARPESLRFAAGTESTQVPFDFAQGGFRFSQDDNQTTEERIGRRLKGKSNSAAH